MPVRTKQIGSLNTPNMLMARTPHRLGCRQGRSAMVNRTLTSILRAYRAQRPNQTHGRPTVMRYGECRHTCSVCQFLFTSTTFGTSHLFSHQAWRPRQSGIRFNRILSLCADQSVSVTATLRRGSAVLAAERGGVPASTARLSWPAATPWPCLGYDLPVSLF